MNEAGTAKTFRRSIRDLLIASGVGMLSATAWSEVVGAWPQGRGHASPGEPGHHEGTIRHGGGHTEYHGTPYPILQIVEWYLFPGEPEVGPGLPAIAVAGGPVYMLPSHPAHLASHLAAGHPQGPEHHVLPLHAGQAPGPQPTGPGAAESVETGAATAQPGPIGSSALPRPPGAAGPGQPTSGLPGPGMLGPGQPARPRP